MARPEQSAGGHNIQPPTAMPEAYAGFLDTLGQGLDLPLEQIDRLRPVAPIMWLAWMRAVLADDENGHMPSVQSVVGAEIPLAATNLMGGAVQHGGREYIDFRLGTLGQGVERWAQDDDEVAQGSFQGFSHASAAFLQAIGDQMGRKSEEWLRHIPTTPQTRLRFDQNGRVGVMFSRAEDFWLTVNGPVDTIINLGPGLTGARFAADISGRTQDIHYVSGDISAHFVNSWIELGLSAEATRQDGLRRAGRLAEKYFLPSDHDVRLPEAHFYDKGIAAAMRDIAQTLDKPADVIVMSAAHGTGPQECLASIRPDLLRPGGLWVVKAPLRSLDVTEAGFDVLAEPATAIFGTPIAFGPCGSMNQIIDPAQPAERPACYAIYQKQA